MRITQGIWHREALRHLERLQEALHEVQTRIGTGYRINRPSDDPAALVMARRLAQERALREGYLRHIDFARGFTEATAGALDRMLNQLAELSELATRGASDGLGPEERRSLAAQARALLQELVSELNGQHAGWYLFSGTRIHTQPFLDGGGTYLYQGNGEELLRDVGPGVTVPLGLPGNRIHDLGGGQTLTGVALGLVAALQSGDRAAIQGSIGELARAQEHVRALAVEMGARLRWLDSLQERHLSDIEQLEALRSRLEDTDYARAASELERAQTVYTATAKVISWRLPQSLVDYLR
jgi:flagellar hook-associated protein 3 FlgL